MTCGRWLDGHHGVVRLRGEDHRRRADLLGQRLNGLERLRVSGICRRQRPGRLLEERRGRRLHASLLRAGHRMTANEIGRPCRLPDNGALRAADIGDDRARLDSRQHIGQRRQDVADGGAEHNDVRLPQALPPVSRHGVHRAQSQCRVQPHRIAPDADDVPRQPPRLQRHPQRPANEAHAENGNRAELCWKMSLVGHGRRSKSPQNETAAL